MSNSYPPPAPSKRLVRSTSNRVIGGVCAGVADYLNMDANLVRILTVLISLFTGVPVILYIVALFVMPEDTAVQTSAPPPVAGSPSYPGPFSATESGTPAPAYAPYPDSSAGSNAPRPTAEDAVWGSEGPPWEQRQPESAPSPQPTPSAQTEPVAPSSPEAPVVPPVTEGEEGQSEDKPAS
jgi:phage shock protein PspC (stress-responsive transcriptional regulator)